MELGKGRLLRTGLNALYQAIHPVHGLVWTDGRQVVLTDLQLHSGEARFGDSKVIGQFEHVYGVSWAPPAVADVPALLAVQHKKHVALWQLCPSTTETSRWLMSQTCEIRESLPVLPQGCVWHPKSPVLAVLTAQDVSVLPSVYGDGPRVKADVNTRGLIHCACWTQDGRRLVVAVGSSLHSYIWDSAQKTLRRCSFYPVFAVDSYVRSIGATADSQVAVATELPLDKICGLNASETFDVPPGGEDTRLCASPVTDEGPTGDQGAVASETHFETSVSPISSSFSDPLDLTHIHSSTAKSEGSSLICLRKKDYLTGTGLDSSHLVLVTFEKEVTQTRKVTIPGILAPDLIALNPKAQVVAVASNTYHVIFIYSVIPSCVPNIRQIQLERSEKPKGICFLTDKLLLILVGRQKSTDSAFLPSSKTDQYIIRLIVREVTLEEESPVTASENQSGVSTLSILLNKTDRKKLIESLSPDFCHPNRGLLTANGSGQSGRPGKTLIKEIKSPPTSVCEGPIALDALDGEPVNRSVTLPRSSGTPHHTLTPEPPDWPPSKNLQREKEISRLSKEMEILSRTLTEVQRRLSELTDVLQKEKFSPGYPLSQDPPYVHVAYQKSYYVGPVVEKRAILLCNGKLRLSTVQQTFGLSLVEMLHDSHWILLCADSEGFIPLTFTATQEITIRDGSANVFTDSVSES
ncbi:WD repeat and coiled-coil-containing protein [Callorhinus ursinus]|uniref:WD repeat and coiled-coil-containing protein n=1 Tax=Callorhinus ursinus TaxID=34884 RepID=A0A3Q7Q5T6_CALUR|nr:WD repeat and coiled-coil-containing protein [Callorhinus ursinus]XP_025723596.1 WD repeat and coiled-coil-containing protein [Callorhinus ursinus]XP_025723597.1 WD repeat and coiled-coil-containing protein [Callorhinus ursinus]